MEKWIIIYIPVTSGWPRGIPNCLRICMSKWVTPGHRYGTYSKGRFNQTLSSAHLNSLLPSQSLVFLMIQVVPRLPISNPNLSIHTPIGFALTECLLQLQSHDCRAIPIGD